MSWAGLGRDPDDKPARSHDFQWLEQAEEAVHSAHGTTLSSQARTGLWRYAGHCYLQSAFQSQDQTAFTERMKRAEGCFKNAAVSPAHDGGGRNHSSKKRFEGLAAFCRAQRGRDDSPTLKELHEAHDLLREAWGDENSERNNSIVVLAFELLHVTNDLMHYEPEVAQRLTCLQAAGEVSKQAKTLLPQLDKNLLPLFLAELVELETHLWIHLPAVEEREAEGRRGLYLFERLRQEISGSDDGHCAVATFALQIMSEELLPKQPPVLNVEAFRPLVEATKDRVAIGTYLAAILRSKLGSLRDIEDPERAKTLLAECDKDAQEALRYLQAFEGIRRFRTSPGYVLWTQGDLLAMYGRLHAASPTERLRFASEAVTVSDQAGDYAPPYMIIGEYSNLGYYLYQRAVLEDNTAQRERSLEEAWKAGLGYQKTTHQFLPHWDLGDADHFRLYGHIRREQAKARQKNGKSLLNEAIGMYQLAVNSQQRWVNSKLCEDRKQEQKILGQYQYELGSTQIDLYTKTRETQLLEAALSNLQSSASAASSEDIPTRAAETLARIGEAYLLAGQYEQARNSFNQAADRYEAASAKYPGLSLAFQSRSNLMRSRAATALARKDYNAERFQPSADHYREASKLLKATTTWQGLADLYEAWAMVADAEAQSRAEPEKALERLEAAAGQFTQAEKTLTARAPTSTEGEEENLRAQQRFLAQGRGYAQARLLLEKARILERQGEAAKSIDQLAQAARNFDSMGDSADDLETQDLMKNNALVCRASMVMAQAEQGLSPSLYAEASELFLNARKSSRTKQGATIAGGWAACCKAMELGLRYRESSDHSQFEALKKQLSSATGYFVDAGASDIVAWLKGTGCMFDAMAHLAEGEAKLSTGERESHYRLAEQQLQAAAQFFERAGYTARKEDAVRFLQSTVEQRRAIADRVIQDAPVTFAATGITGPTNTQEIPIGGSATATPPIHAALRGPDNPLLPGREAKLQLTILNPGNNILRLVSVENLEDPGLDMRSGTEQHQIRNGKLELEGKRLAPLTVFELPINIKPRRPGEYKIQPLIRFLSPQGQPNSEPTPTLTFKVEKTGIRSWLRGPEN